MFRIFRISFAAGLLCLFLIAAADTVRGQEPPTAEPPAIETEPPLMPTVDRLAAPPTVPSPTQADEGAQLYWVWCQPCHGDRGQGLTDEWREQYPEEHQYCWISGCHGPLPYENGFKLPKHVPALIGGQSLARFQTMAQLYEYSRDKMPFEYPGALSEEEYLAVTAYLARAHDKWDGTRLTTANVEQIRLQPLPTATPPPPAAAQVGSMLANNEAFIIGGMLLGLTLLGGAYLWRQRT